MLFGAHESIAGGVDKAIERAQRATCDTIQIFNKSNNQWRAAELKPEVVENYFKLQEETGISVATSHSSYLINIASPDKALRKKSLDALKVEMDRCNLLKIPSLVMHPGSHVGSGEELGLATITEQINVLFDELKDNQCTLLLETTAGQGSNLGHTFEQLATIIEGVEDSDHIGVCLDTCHVFAAGYPIHETKGFKKTIRDFNQIIGLDRLKIVHVNDSKKPFGSRRDRHEHLGKGCIGEEAFRCLVNDRRLKKIPMILETPKGDDLQEDRENLAYLRGLVGKKAEAATS